MTPIEDQGPQLLSSQELHRVYDRLEHLRKEFDGKVEALSLKISAQLDGFTVQLNRIEHQTTRFASGSAEFNTNLVNRVNALDKSMGNLTERIIGYADHPGLLIVSDRNRAKIGEIEDKLKSYTRLVWAMVGFAGAVLATVVAEAIIRWVS